jgi:hypothetical protein
MTMPATTEPFPVLDYILKYEQGEATANEVLELFAYLVRTGQAWTLQGSYGRAARDLIDGGYLDTGGNVLRDLDEF